MKKYFCYITLLFFIIGFAKVGSAPLVESTQPHLVIDYVSTIRGYIETCGCHSGNYGGIARRGSYLTKFRQENPNDLVLFGGDLNIGAGQQDQIKADYLFQAIQGMKYDAFNIGESEFMYGWQYLEEKEKENPIFISANILNAKTQKPAFTPYITRQISYTYETVDSKNNPKTVTLKENIAIVGVLGSALFPSVQNYLSSDTTLITLADPSTILSNLIPTLRKKNDIVIVLAHVTQSEGEYLARGIPGIDIMITGHDGIQMTASPILAGRTILVTNGDRGRYGGQLGLLFNKDKHIANYRGKEFPLDGTFTDDTEMSTLVQSYKKALLPLPPH